MTIILTRKGSQAEKLLPTSFPKERELQAYVAANPECIPMEEIEEGLHLLILGREFPTDSGPIDVLAMDATGLLYLIETKLYSNFPTTASPATPPRTSWTSMLPAPGSR